MKGLGRIRFTLALAEPTGTWRRINSAISQTTGVTWDEYSPANTKLKGQLLTKFFKDLKTEEKEVAAAHSTEKADVKQLASAKGRGRRNRKPRGQIGPWATGFGYPKRGKRPPNVDVRATAGKFRAPLEPVCHSVTYPLLDALKPGPLTALAASSLTVDMGTLREKILETGLGWSNCVLNGVPDPKLDSRFPDPFSLMRSSILTTSNFVTMVAHNVAPGVHTGFTYGVFKGSGVATLGLPLNFGVGPTFDWDLNTGGKASWYDSSTVSANHITRPMGCTLDIKPRLYGIAHSIKLFAFPVPPLKKSNLTVVSPAGWPSTVISGLTPANVSWGGREWTLGPESSGVHLVSVPMDSRGMDFGLSSTERGYWGDALNNAWSTWVFWAYGFAEGDLIDFSINFTEEALVVHNTATVFAYPAAIRQTSGPLRDENVNKVKDAVESGLTGISIIDKTVDFVGKVADWASKHGELIKRIVGGVGGSMGGMDAVAGLEPIPLPVHKPDEEKFELVRPQATPVRR